jgi:hypothetical protein
MSTLDDIQLSVSNNIQLDASDNIKINALDDIQSPILDNIESDNIESNNIESDNTESDNIESDNIESDNIELGASNNIKINVPDDNIYMGPIIQNDIDQNKKLKTRVIRVGKKRHVLKNDD